MARNWSAVVAILAALWLIRDLYALEINQTSNDGDFYFEDSTNRSSTNIAQPDTSSGPFRRRGTYHSAWSKAGDDALKPKDGENDPGKSDNFLKFPEMADSLDVKQLLKYVLSLVYTLNENDEKPSDELKDPSNSDIGDGANSQNTSVASFSLSSQTNLAMVTYTNYTDAKEDDGDISENDERDYADEEDFIEDNESDNDNSGVANNKNNQEFENITTINQVNNVNTTVTPLTENPSINKNQTDMLEKDPVHGEGLKLDAAHSNTTNENGIPETFRLFEEEFIDYYINNQPTSLQNNQQRAIETINNTPQSTVNSNKLNKTTENQAPRDDNVSQQKNEPLNISLIQLNNENINDPNEDQNQQSIPQTSPYNIDPKEISYSLSQTSFPKLDNPVLPSNENEQNSELYRITPFIQDPIVQPPFEDTYARSPFQNVPEPYNPYNKPELFNNQNSFNQKEPIYHLNPVSNAFTSNLNPSTQQLPRNVLPLQFSDLSYNQQNVRNADTPVSELRDQQNKFQQDFLPQNNPIPQYDLNLHANVLPERLLSNPPYAAYYKLKLPLHVRRIAKPSESGSIFSDAPQDRNIDNKFIIPAIQNKGPLYSSVSNDGLINPLNHEKLEPANNPYVLKQLSLLEPQNQFRTPPENPTFEPKNPNNVPDSAALPKQAEYLLIQNEFPQVTIAPPPDTTESFIPNNNDKQISQIQPTNINKSLPQNEYSNPEIQLPQDEFNNTEPQFHTKESSQKDDETKIPSANIQDITTAGQSIMLKNQPNIKPLSLIFYNFSQELEPKGNSTSPDDNRSSGSSDVNESENEVESDITENVNEEESNADESEEEFNTDENEEESDIIENGNEEESNTEENEEEPNTDEIIEESNADESESEEESDTDENEREEESDTDESENIEDNEKSNNDEFEYEEAFDELLRVLDYIEEMIDDNVTTTQSPENYSTSDVEYFTESPTNSNFTDLSTQNENLESSKPDETYNTILEYILKFSNNPFFAGMREEQNVTVQ